MSVVRRYSLMVYSSFASYSLLVEIQIGLFKVSDDFLNLLIGTRFLFRVFGRRSLFMVIVCCESSSQSMESAIP